MTHIIPSITSKAGTCLTFSNWQQVGVKTVACSLKSLLVKPGYSLLQQLETLNQYADWTGDVILNGDDLIHSSNGIVIRSPYDGSYLRFTQDEIIDLAVRLKPHTLILSSQCWTGKSKLVNEIPSAICLYLQPEVILNNHITRSYGIYLAYEGKDFSRFVSTVKHFLNQAVYISGHFTLTQIGELKKIGVRNIETDLPAQDAVEGRVYRFHENVEITAPRYALDFEVIDKECNCPVCDAKLTKAYLHHLFTQTPLLCQRLLIQHNAWVAGNI